MTFIAKVFNMRRSLRLCREASAAQDWMAELHYGGVIIVQGAMYGMLIDLIIAAIVLGTGIV